MANTYYTSIKEAEKGLDRHGEISEYENDRLYIVKSEFTGVFFISKNDSIQENYEKVISKGVYDAQKKIQKFKLNIDEYKEKGIKIVFTPDRIEVRYRYTDRTLNYGPRNLTDHRRDLVFEITREIQKILQCRIELIASGEREYINQSAIPSAYTHLGYLYPYDEVKGYFIQANHSDLKGLKKFSEENNIIIELGFDENKLKTMRNTKSSAWEDIILPYYFGVAYFFEGYDTKAYIRKVPILKSSKYLFFEGMENVNYQIETFDNLNFVTFRCSEIDEWMKFVLQKQKYYQKISLWKKEQAQKRQSNISGYWSDPSRNSYYDEHLDMDQQSEDFWNSI